MLLKMTSGKILTFKDVLYASEIRKNLVSESMWNKHRFHILIESDKVLLTKSGMYIWKGSATMFKLNVLP